MPNPMLTAPDLAADPRLQPPPPADLPPNPVPSSCLLVGIGASAGGVQALRKFFSNVQPGAGMVYLVVLHLSPAHESNLPQILQDTCAIPVTMLQGDTPIQPDHAYVVPPHHRAYFTDGWLRTAEINQERGLMIPIDLSLRSLAETYGPQSACVILSGTGSDGTQGLKRVKEMGGLTFVQDLADAEHEEMPQSALDTRVVDCVMTAAQMPENLLAQWRIGREIVLPANGDSEDLPLAADEIAAASVRDILSMVRARTGNDFSRYKRATILRRIARRMQVNHIHSLPDYLDFLSENPSEVPALLRDFMISVTEFFRDPEAFQELENLVIRRLFTGKESQEELRVWVPACATGEEAYSLAMLLHECANMQKVPPRIQVFASDIDANAINIAREGVFEQTIAADMTPERLRAFFIKDGRHFRVRKELRESILFATHNVLTDPPFSRIDLISCRNLLIYLNQEMQERVLELFHFALRHEGFLFLGASESADERLGLFAPLAKRERVYQRRPGITPIPALRNTPSALPLWTPRGMAHVETGSGRPISFAELHLHLLDRATPASVLVNETYEILHLGHDGGRYLRVPGGEPSRNLLRVVHQDLRLELRTALYTALQKHTVEVRRVLLEENGGSRLIQMTVRPVDEPEAARGYLLVFFEEVQPDKTPVRRRKAAPETDPLAQQLEDELQRIRSEMRTAVEQYEIGNEELRASNEELQAINEELRSATEELETSKEELQSLNEELTTVNHELHCKVDELSRANTDLRNLMASTDIGTIFLDRGLHIKRYTPAAERIFNLIPTDEGRPLSDLSHSLDYPEMTRDAQQVLDRLAPVDREVRSADGRHYLVRFTPYRTLEDRIDGVVVTFLDITEMKSTVAALAESEERFRLLVDGAQVYAMFLLDTERRVIFWSAGAERVLGYTPAEMIGQCADLIFTPEDRAARVPVREAEMSRQKGFAPDRRWHVRRSGERFWADGIMTSLLTGKGELRGYAKVFRDATEEKDSQDNLAQAHDLLEERVRERTAELQKAHAERQALVQQLITAEEAERRRIARELHDQTGQQLAGLILELRRLSDQLKGNPEVQASVAKLQTLADRIGQEVHSLAFELRPTSLDDLGLARALDNYLVDWSSRNGIQAQFHEQGVSEKRVRPEIETALYRIVQESLHNISRHAGASTVSVILERRDEHVQAIIEDTGAGFEADEVLEHLKGSKHLGISGMQERAALLGGEVTIESNPGEGTTVYARIPLAKPKRRSG